MERTWSVYHLVFVCAIAALFSDRRHVSAASEADLQQFLLANYTTTARPRLDASQTVDVGLELEISNIIAIDDKDQIFTVLGFIISEWYDDYLVWDPANYGGIETIVLPGGSTWLPDIVVINSMDPLYSEERLYFRVKVDYDGLVTWSFGGVFALYCGLDLSYYPYDLQTCRFEVENWAYTGSQVSLYNLTADVAKDNFREHGVWKWVESSTSHQDLYYDFNPGVPYPKITFTLYLKRKLSFYAINLVVPILMLLLLNLSLFWLPPDSGEKVSYGVTIMLSFSVYQLILIDATPENSDYTPLLTLLVLFVMGVSTFSTIFSVFIVYIHSGKPYPVPRWLRCFLFRGLAQALCMANSVPRDNHVHDLHGNQGHEKHSNSRTELMRVGSTPSVTEEAPCGGNEPGEGSALMRAILENLRVQADDLKEKIQEQVMHNEWKAVARVLDRFAFWLILLVEMIFLIWASLQQDTVH